VGKDRHAGTEGRQARDSDIDRIAGATGPTTGDKRMPEYAAITRITNLRLRTFIGFNPDERSKQQDVVINAEIHHRVRPAALEDEVEAALDYKVLTKAIIDHVESGRFLLLERLSKDLVDICRRDPAVTRAIVTVDKPHALRFADSVSLTLEFDRARNQPTSEREHAYHTRTFSKAS
jgi:D-erythro-7,8-dihydroneopterin triphosphate epimerase